MAAAKVITTSDTMFPVSPTPTLVSSPTVSTFSKTDAAKRALFTDNYLAAFSDTYGVVGDVPFIYKTGSAWPQRTDAQPYLREMRPVAHTHTIRSKWAGIVHDIEAHFKQANVPLTIIAGLAFGNQGQKETFCELIVVIGVPPTGFKFTDIKAAAEYTQRTILTNAEFPDIDVAVREWEVNPSGAGPKLPSLDPLFDGDVTEFRHLFTSNPGLAVAPLKRPSLEGTVGAYFRLSRDNDSVLALTCCHVASPSRATTDLTIAEAAAHHEGIIAIGSGAYEAGTTAIMERIGTLQGIVVSEKAKIERLAQRLADGSRDPATIAEMTEEAEKKVETAARNIGWLDRLHDWVTKYLTNPKQRRVGRVYFASPISPSSDDPASAYTVDWAFILLDKDAFKPEFTGNKVFVGGRVREEEYCNLMFPWPADRAGYRYPQDGLLQIFGYVPESEMLMPTQLGANGGPRMPVIKNGRTTGTTVGWLNGLKSFVRRYRLLGVEAIEFGVMETTIVPYGGRGAFSAGGDSGSAILDRNGRFVALLTGGGGLTNKTDITFATAACKLLPRINEAVPGASLFPAVSGN